MFPVDISADPRRTLYFVTFHGHRYTFASVASALEARGVRAECLSWSSLFASTELPHGTWVLSDFERLSAQQLLAAGKLRKRLLAAGCRVLNDPAKWLPRADFLRTLYLKGINTFQCWRPAVQEWPDRFPVFLRQASAHQGAKSDLLANAQEARAAFDAALAEGLPLTDLLFVEYAGAPVPDRRFFRKLSGYRVGPEVVRGASVHDTHWMAKDGMMGLADDADYAAERAEMDAYPHEDLVWNVCDLIGLEFGRVDFGLRAGRPEIWEINSNPMIHGPHDHPNADRVATVRQSFEGLVEAFWILARSPGDPVSIETCFARQKQENRPDQMLVELRSQ
ncbi:hypothetical protein [Pacificoceanicola onchidii]|uniref:hypothetical protein n=1 Tax=Pacificoceanicola onchidii TaxID=2562685 RepID=UPI0010A42C66|nr:hypothetical protein [Pacificoceanicola onchidii]